MKLSSASAPAITMITIRIFKEAVPLSQASLVGLRGLDVPLNAGVMRRFERVVALLVG